MTKQSIAIALALIVAVMPFLGFSNEMSDIYYTVAGVIIAALIHLSTIKYCHVCQEKIDNNAEDEKFSEKEEDYIEGDEIVDEDALEIDNDNEIQNMSENKEELDKELNP